MCGLLWNGTSSYCLGSWHLRGGRRQACEAVGIPTLLEPGIPSTVSPLRVHGERVPRREWNGRSAGPARDDRHDGPGPTGDPGRGHFHQCRQDRSGWPSDVVSETCKPVETIDCSGKTVLPGMIDAHGHGGHSLIKTLGSDSPSVWMQIVTPAYFHFTTPSYWYADGLVSALERLRAGVTCGVSVMGSRPRSDDPRFGVEHARAYREVGIREVVAVGPSGLPWPHPVSRWDTGTRCPTRRHAGRDARRSGERHRYVPRFWGQSYPRLPHTLHHRPVGGSLAPHASGPGHRPYCRRPATGPQGS